MAGPTCAEANITHPALAFEPLCPSRSPADRHGINRKACIHRPARVAPPWPSLHTRAVGLLAYLSEECHTAYEYEYVCAVPCCQARHRLPRKGWSSTRGHWPANATDTTATATATHNERRVGAEPGMTDSDSFAQESRTATQAAAMPAGSTRGSRIKSQAALSANVDTRFYGTSPGDISRLSSFSFQHRHPTSYTVPNVSIDASTSCTTLKSSATLRPMQPPPHFAIAFASTPEREMRAQPSHFSAHALPPHCARRYDRGIAAESHDCGVRPAVAGTIRETGHMSGTGPRGHMSMRRIGLWPSTIATLSDDSLVRG
ncbi:Uncharacterized protein TPAR_08972 [Tolypocladium paradoxum]|uniref:Uncharacterized protein n=1 Tax=Tolypocladium paradoxum TaxID=94208 RepID=A0A2S4L767_9HYPO|nr:Uncharacterized protein TPAR_08972 [Tolypocladium paradoxum]